MTTAPAKTGLYVPPGRRANPSSAPPSQSATTTTTLSDRPDADRPGPSRPNGAYRPPGQRAAIDAPSFLPSSSQTYKAPWNADGAGRPLDGRAKLGQPSGAGAHWGRRDRNDDDRPYVYDRPEDAPGGSMPVGAGRNGWARERDGRTAYSQPALTGTPGRPMAASSPTLFVFGDSFTGPLKLLTKDCCKVQPYKGASAKGLNNPNSLKQVAKELVPAVNSWLAPPPYVYTPATGRFALFIFGNVDLQINYLWQLQNKRLSAASFTPGTASPQYTASTQSDETIDKDSSILASATETSLSGPALGPELFVDGIVKAYTSFLEREIVNGPVGQRVRDATTAPSRRVKANNKVLVAAALPPLVEDHVLPRIPEKYVERLEEDHARMHQVMERTRSAGRSPVRSHAAGLRRSHPRDAAGDEDGEVDTLEVGLSTVQLSDDPPESASTGSSVGVGTASSPPSSPPSSRADEPLPSSGKTSIQDLLLHDPPLCTLPVRIAMTDRYNALLSAFCAQYPDILAFVDIAPAMLAADADAIADPPSAPASDEEEEQPPEAEDLPAGAVSRRAWACPVDATNIHPLWEPTLPLWLDALRGAGVPTDGFGISQDAEATFAAYELDKKRRVEARGRDWGATKLRDEE